MCNAELYRQSGLLADEDDNYDANDGMMRMTNDDADVGTCRQQTGKCREHN
jgi:hypothetical protein